MEGVEVFKDVIEQLDLQALEKKQKAVVMVNAWNPSTQKVKARGSGILGHTR